MSIVKIAVAGGIALLASHCDSKANQEKPASKKEGANVSGAEGGEGEGSGSGSGSGSGNEGGAEGGSSTGAATGDKKNIATFCTEAKKEAPIKGQLGDVFKELCGGSGPTALVDKLIAKAYAGSGDSAKAIEYIKPIGSKGNITSTLLAVGIKLKSAKTHFDKVGSKQCDKKSLGKLVEAQQATQDLLEVDDLEAEGKRKGGCEVESKSSKKVAIITVTTHTKGKNERFELAKDVYLYTQQTTEAIKTIKEFDLMSAAVQVGDAGYLLAVVKLAVESPLASAAESELKKTIASVVKTMYDAAKAEGAALHGGDDGEYESVLFDDQEE